MTSATFLAPGKVNLALQILGRREDGYHLMEMVMQSVDLADEVTISLTGGSEITASSDRPGLSMGEDNLAVRCARAFFRETGVAQPGLEIAIVKRIPMEAGLAGGSADGAAVLYGLDALLETSLPREVLCRIGAGVGADIPFCLTGAAALALGAGERLIPLPHLPKCAILIAKPSVGMSTPKAFRLFDRRGGFVPRPEISGMLRALRGRSLSGVAGCMVNAFEEPLGIPEVAAVKASMLEAGALASVMTGSGTAVIGLYPDRAAASKAAAKVEKLGAGTWVSAPVNHGVVRISGK